MLKLRLWTILGLFCFVLTAYSQEGGPFTLFSTQALAPSNNSQVAERENLRYRLVSLNSRSIEQLERLELNLFPDLSLTADHAYTVNQPLLENGYTWVGSIQNSVNGRVFLTFSEEAVSGYILYGSRYFTLRPLDNQTAMIEEVTVDQIEISENDYPIPAIDTPSVVYSEQVTPLTTEDEIVLDLMVVYTELARLRLGGTPIILNYIATSVTIANDDLHNSQLNIRYNLVHMMEVIMSQNFSSGQMLEMLRRQDGNIDEVLTARDQYQADFVSFVHRPLDYICGRAFILNQLDAGWRDEVPFNLVDMDCLLGHAMSHELGHNLGLQHNVEDADPNQMIFPFAFGYRDPSYFRTVMAYACAEATPCDQIGYFSNQIMLDPFNQRPMGTSQADNRSVLTYTSQVARYFRGCPDSAAYDVAAGNTVALVQAVYAAMSDNCSESEPIIYLDGGTYDFTTVHVATQYVGASALPLLSANITIDGEGATLNLDAGAAQRLIMTDAYNRLTLRNLTIQGGDAGDFPGGAIYSRGELVFENVNFINNTARIGGAVYAEKTMIVQDSLFSNNTSVIYGGAILSDAELTTIDNSIFRLNQSASGGAIYSGSLTLTNSLIEDNLATYDPSGQGGGIYAFGAITIRDTIIQDNRADDSAGAKLISYDAPIIIEDSTFEGNIATESNGALYADTNHLQVRRVSFLNNQAGAAAAFFLGRGRLTMEDSRFYYNQATNAGGALYLDTGGTIIRSVFYENEGNLGGAIYQRSTKTLTISNSIFVGNHASLFGGAIYNAAPTVLRHNSFVDNTAVNNGETFYSNEVALTLFANAIEGLGTKSCFGNFFTSQGYNIVTDNSCPLFTATGDSLNTPPLFAVFAFGGDNSLALLAGSPALNVIPLADCTTVVRDFLRRVRPQGYACDSGAIEMLFPILDSNNDSLISPSDVVLVINRLGLPVEAHRAADSTGDGLIDTADIQVILEALED